VAASSGDLVETGDGCVGVDAVVDHIGERFTGELIDDVQDLDDPAADGDVELVVECPHVIRMLRPQPVRWRRRGAKTLALAAPGRHSQALLPPQPLHLLAIHDMAFPAQHRVGPPVAPPRMAGREAA
jgi:hypothetical protein